ncbi:MAG: cupredoxin domain-containing protein [Nitrospira sp.]|nr:cupredoxin domain-containing protein [Nitrospira sp.]
MGKIIDNRGEKVPSRSRLIAFAIQLVLGIGMGGIGLAEELLYEPDVVVVMKNKAFQVIKDGPLENSQSTPAFSLPVGMDLAILLRNEDEVAHEFVSPLLMKAEDLEISGRATIVYTLTAFGVRVEPRDRVMLRFSVPEASLDRFHFWCNLHGKLLSDTMRGEIFIVDAKPSSK